MSGVQNNYSLEFLQLISKSGGATDLIPYMYGLEIFEDIHSPFLHAQVDVMETESIIEQLPLVGDEFVVAVLRIHGIHKTSEKFITFTMDVYKIEDEQMYKHKATVFRMLLISQSFKKNASKRNRKYYIGTQDLIANMICGIQLERPIIRTDPCMFEEEYIFPNWHPVGCINHLAKNSVSMKYNDPDYVFYEDLEGYHYLSMSYIMDVGNGFVESSDGGWFKAPIIQQFTSEKDDFTVSEYHKKHAFDMIDNTNKGMYGTTLIYTDTLNRWWDESGSNYQSTFGNFKHLASVPLTLFADASNEKNRMVYVPMNGLLNPGVYRDVFYQDQKKNLIIRQMQSEQNLMVLEIEGEPNMEIGKVMGFDLHSVKKEDADTLHDKLYGFFLINKVRHVFARDKYVQYVEISKDSYFK